MNKIFKVIWNSATQTWVVVSELGKAKGKKSKLNKQIPSLKLTMVLSSVGFSLMSIDALAAAAVYIGDGAVLGKDTQAQAQAQAQASIVIGKDSSAKSPEGNSANGALNAIVIGNNATAKSNANIVIGDSANVDGAYSIVIGRGATITPVNGKIVNNALVIGKDAKAKAQGAISLGLESEANGERAIAIGGKVGSVAGTVANGSDSIAFGIRASTSEKGQHAIAFGVNSTAKEVNAMALGTNSSSAGLQSLAVGAFANASELNSIAIGTSAISSAIAANALGYNSKAAGAYSTSLGSLSKALGENATALGTNATAKEKGGVAIATNATSTGKETIAIGFAATATHITNLKDPEGDYITDSIGVETGNMLVPSIAIGSRSNATSANAISIGTNSNATGNRAIGLGSGTNATGNRSVALGWLSRTEGNRSSAVGAGTNVTGNYSSAVGTGSIVNGTSSGAFGAYSNVTGNNTYVLGSNVSVATDGSVILGNSSAASQAMAVNTATINGITYNKFAGNTNIAVGDYVSIGSSGQERQIKNVAPGNISLTSTDAINGSQLYLIAVEAAKNNTVTSADGSVIITTSPHANGSINYDLKVVGSSVVVPSVQAGNHTKVSTTVNSNGSTNYIVDADNTIVTSSDRSVSVTATSKSNTDGSLTYTYDLAVPDSGTGRLNNNPDGKVQSDDSTGKLANVADVANAINKSGWNTTLSNGNQAQINPGDTLNYVNGNGTKAVVTQDSSSPNIFNVSFDVSNANPTSVNANGSLAVPEDGSSFVNATTLVNSINKVGWNVFEENDQSTNLKDRVTAGDNIVFANGTNTLVNVSNIGNTTTITYSVKAGKLTHNADGTVSSENTDGTVATVEDVATAINSSGWNTTLSNGDQAQINPGDSLNYVNGNGTTAVIKRDPHSLNIFNVSFDVNNAGETRVTGGKIELPNEIDGAKYVNATTLVNAINKAGFTLKHSATDGGENLGGDSELINAGDTVEMIAGKNLSVKQGANGTITYATKENVSFSNAQVNSTFSIGNNTTDNPTVNFNTTAGSPTNVTNNGGESTSPTALNLTDSEGNPVQIKGVESSLTVNQLPTNDGNGTTDSTNLLNLTNADPNSAVTVGDLQNYGWVVSTPDNQFTQAVKNANEVKFTGSDGIKVAGAVDSTGVYNITFEVNAGELKPNANGTISTLTTNGTVATVGDVANAINNSGWNTTLSNGDQAQINPGDTLNYVDGNGTTATVKQDPNNPNVFNVSFDVNNANPTTVNNNGSLATPAGNEGANFVNATTLVDAINKAGFTLKHSAVDGGEDLEGDAELINPGDVIEMIAGKNLSVKQGANGTITYATKENVSFDNVQVNSTLTVGNNTADNPSVTFNTEAGSPTNVTNNGGDTTNPTALNLTDSEGKPVQIKGVESSLTLRQVPTADKDGSNASNVNLIDLANATDPNSAVTVGDLQNYGWVVSTPDNAFKQAVKNANQVNFVGSEGVNVEGSVSEEGVYNVTFGVKAGEFTSNPNGTVSAQTNNGTVATVGDVANAINNSGWNTTLSDGSSAQINPGDTLNYVDGNGTTAVVKQDPSNPNVFNVSFDVNNATPTTVDNSGKLNTPDAEEGKNFVNATTLVDAINKAGFTLKHSATSEGKDEGGAEELINPGDVIEMIAGKNLSVKQGANGTITYATKDDVVFENTVVNSTLTVGNNANGNPSVNFNTEEGTATNVTSNGTENLTPAALNLTDVNGEPVQLKGIESSLTLQQIPTADKDGSNPSNVNLINLTNANPNAAVTVADLQNYGWVVATPDNQFQQAVRNANHVNFVAGTGVSVEGAVSSDGVYNITIATNVSDITGSVTPNNNGTVTANNSTGNVATVGDVANAINNSGWNTTLSDGSSAQINPGDTLNYVDGNGTTAVVKQDPSNPNVFNVSFDVNNANLTTADDSGKLKTPDAEEGKNFVNATTLVDAVNKAAWNVASKAVDGTNGENEYSVDANSSIHAGDTVNIDAGKNIKITGQGDTIEIHTTDDVVFNTAQVNSTLNVGGADGVTIYGNGTIGINGKDGIPGKDGQPGMNGSNATVTVVEGTPGINGKDGETLTRVVYTDANGTTHEIATLDDGLKFKGDTGEVIAKKLGETLEIIGRTDVNANVTDKNLRVDNEEGKLVLKMAKELQEINSISNNNGTTITLGDANNNNTVNINNATISNVAPGVNGTDAVNVDQLEKVNATANAGWTITTNEGNATYNVKPNATVDLRNADGNIVISQDNGNITFDLNSTLTIGGKDGKDGQMGVAGKDGADGVTIYGNGTIGINGRDGVDGKPGANASVTVIEGTPGINGKDGETLTRVVYTDANGTTHEIATLDDGLKFKGDTGEVIAKKLGETLEIIGRTAETANVTDKNLRVDNEEGKLVLKMAKELQEINSISNNNGTTITLGDANNNNTVNINNATISNVAPGVNGTDAVNVDQLEKVNATANAGWFMTTNHGDKSFNVKPNASVDLRTANNNLVITQEDGNITFGLSNNLNLTSNGSVTVGNTTIDNSGLTIKDGPSITENGVDAGDKKVTNVSNGTISAESKDAINGSQLYAVKQIAEAGWNLSVNEGEDAGNVAPGANVDLRNSDGNIVISKDANNVTFNLAKDIKVDTLKANTSVTVGNGTVHTSIMNNGITVKGENSTVILTDKGLDNGGNKITNVAAGTNATDAVNVSQLNSTIAGVQWKLTGNNDNANATTVGSQTVSFNDSESVKANVDGVNVSFSVKAGELGNEAGKVTSNSTNGTVATVKNVADAINNSGWNIALTDGSNELVKPGDIVKFVNGSGTTANVAKNANGGVEVSFNVNNAEAPKVNEDGSINVPSSENGGSHYVNATTLATTVNNAAWNVDSKAAGGTVINVVNEKRVDSQAATKVKAGNTVNINAGNNIEITRSGADITVATSMTPTFNTVQVGGKEGVTLGSSTAKDGVKELSVGARGAEARITNVAPGIADTDAVNVGQLKQGFGNVQSHINKVDRNLRAGIAGANAAAGLPQVYIPGKSMVAASAGTFKGQSAVAVGYSRASDNGKVILKLQGNANTRGDFGGSVGVGYQW
ncbi:Autotransporter adhesin [Bibersteinia trehalosi USDA-ARS-USMARC-188]|uniref:Autotransporter adhesin n=1 Tax=Bibersteinia trehalosi USDA-ARS-USMARC-188 TaxID=1263829 RepID=A0A4V7I8T0_BIBTR|nr:YadA-like family protein [Bibersteinia trehalosi]AHG81406.1 Autotransporter adhesin [Bibersteinia trehalosi USDA-ARS-USMARC-188]